MFSSSLGLFVQHVYTWREGWKIKSDIPAGTVKYGSREHSTTPDQQLWFAQLSPKGWSLGHDATAGKENKTKPHQDQNRLPKKGVSLLPDGNYNRRSVICNVRKMLWDVVLTTQGNWF